MSRALNTSTVAYFSPPRGPGLEGSLHSATFRTRRDFFPIVFEFVLCLRVWGFFSDGRRGSASYWYTIWGPWWATTNGPFWGTHRPPHHFGFFGLHRFDAHLRVVFNQTQEGCTGPRCKQKNNPKREGGHDGCRTKENPTMSERDYTLSFTVFPVWQKMQSVARVQWSNG